MPSKSACNMVALLFYDLLIGHGLELLEIGELEKNFGAGRVAGSFL